MSRFFTSVTVRVEEAEAGTGRPPAAVIVISPAAEKHAAVLAIIKPFGWPSNWRPSLTAAQHEQTRLLIFNTADFRRFDDIIEVIAP
jgi:hypothetical protein